jgi:A/G-specific adenine glycosylase
MKQDTTSDIRNAMIDWYDNHRRDLPWRSNPFEKPDPYHVWMSEIMLQQTTVGAVKSYFEKFVRIWPTVFNLANAPIEDVMREWAGLGYYSRARNLHKCANEIVKNYNGVFPNDTTELKKLPGIGDYTSAAISSIAFDIPNTVIDGNVDRVVSRLYSIETPLPHSKPEIRENAKKIFEGMNKNRPSCFAQSLMDLGATICVPKSPKCMICPIRNFCDGYRKGTADSLPNKVKKKKSPEKHAYVYINFDEHGHVEIETRPEKGMLGGMVGFPTSEWIDKSEALINVDKNHCVRHVFTHFALTLYPVIQKAEFNNKIKFNKIEKIGLPTLFKKVWLLTKDKVSVVE